MAPGLTPLTALVTALLSPTIARAFATAIASGIPRLIDSLASLPLASVSKAATTSATLARGTPLSAAHRGPAHDPNDVVRMGIIRGGAAGLAAARAFLRANARDGGLCFKVTMLEARDYVGGIRKYDKDECSSANKMGRPPKSRLMYCSLQTSLRRELMAFRELAWGGDGKAASYVTHGQVQ